MTRIGVVLGRGGHTAQTFSLVDLLGRKFEYLYFIGLFDKLTPKKIRIPGKKLLMITPRLLPQDSKVMSVLRTLFSFILSLTYLLVYRPTVIVSCGTGLTVPIFFVARFLGIRTVFIESMSRVESLSQTGRILLGKTSLFFVQWKDLAAQVPGVLYGGQLL